MKRKTILAVSILTLAVTAVRADPARELYEIAIDPSAFAIRMVPRSGCNAAGTDESQAVVPEAGASIADFFQARTP